MRLGPLSTTEGRKSAELHLMASHHCRPNGGETPVRADYGPMTVRTVDLLRSLQTFKSLRTSESSESTDFGVHGLRGNISRLRGATGALSESRHMRCDGKECLVEATQEHGHLFRSCRTMYVPVYKLPAKKETKIRTRRIRDMEPKTGDFQYPFAVSRASR